MAKTKEKIGSDWIGSGIKCWRCDGYIRDHNDMANWWLADTKSLPVQVHWLCFQELAEVTTTNCWHCNRKIRNFQEASQWMVAATDRIVYVHHRCWETLHKREAKKWKGVST